jgi:hypothetical protein
MMMGRATSLFGLSGVGGDGVEYHRLPPQRQPTVGMAQQLPTHGFEIAPRLHRKPFRGRYLEFRAVILPPTGGTLNLGIRVTASSGPLFFDHFNFMRRREER